MLMALTLCQGTELTSSPNIPPRLLNHSSDACGCKDNSHGPDGTCCWPLQTCLFLPAVAPRSLRSQTRNLPSTPAFSFCPSHIQVLKTVKFAFLTSLD